MFISIRIIKDSIVRVSMRYGRRGVKQEIKLNSCEFLVLLSGSGTGLGTKDTCISNKLNSIFSLIKKYPYSGTCNFNAQEIFQRPKFTNF